MQDDFGQRFGAAELLLLSAETDEMLRKPKGNDLAGTVRQQAVETHHSAFDAVDMSLCITFVECVLMGPRSRIWASTRRVSEKPPLLLCKGR